MKEIDLNLPAKSDGTTIRKHTDDLLQNATTLFQLGYISEQELALLMLCCEFHDYGKCTADFQERLKTHAKMDPENELPHNVLSTYFIDKNRVGKEAYPVVFHAVLNHHFYANNIDIIRFEKERILEKVEMYAYEKPKAKVIQNAEEVAKTPMGILMKGLLHKCDYSASAGIPIELKNDFLESAMQSLLDEWTARGVATQYNEMQLFCRKNHDQNIVITAPTGMGKTEASLLWVGNAKAFYILPIRTAIHCIYERIVDGILHGENVEKRVALLHSNTTAFLMDKYENTEIDLFEYLDFSKQLSLPFTISTPDQLFNFVFRYKGYELKLATLRYAKVVIDEIQAYSPELLAYIIYGLHEIVRMGGQFAIFTATLPPFVRHLLNEPYEKEPYSFQDFTHEQRRHNIKVITEMISAEFIYDVFLSHENADSNKILVVCNTVKMAQGLYLQLRELLGELREEKVHLLHSKLIQKDRKEREEAILRDGQTEQKTSVIWITTQIVEASVDIDFDFILTELSDLNGLFQRLGRCNRKGVKSVDAYNSYVFTEINQNIIVNRSTNRGFIDGEIHRLSKLALEDVDGVISEKKKSELLNRFFTYERMKQSDFLQEYKYYYDYLNNLYDNESDLAKVNQKFRNIVSVTVIPEIVFQKYRVEIAEKEEVLHQSFSSKKAKADAKELLLEKERAKKYLQDLSVGVYPYDFTKDQVVAEVVVSQYEKIRVVQCEYGVLGYRRLMEENEVSNQEGIFL